MRSGRSNTECSTTAPYTYTLCALRLNCLFYPLIERMPYSHILVPSLSGYFIIQTQEGNVKQYVYCDLLLLGKDTFMCGTNAHILNVQFLEPFGNMAEI